MTIKRDKAALPESVLAATVERIARGAGRIALSHFRALKNGGVEEKGHLDLVTQADREVEAFLVDRLRQAFPEDGVFGEEGGNVTGSSTRIWVIDPIDGTFNFVRGGQNWAISIGLFQDRRPTFGVIYVPARDLMLTGGGASAPRLNGNRMPPLPALNMTQASTGIGFHPSVATSNRLEVLRFVSDDLRINFRSCGSSALSIIEVAMGETDGYVALGDSTWDVMAGLPILASLGLSNTIDWDRTELQDKLWFACGQDLLVEKVRPLLESLGAQVNSGGSGHDDQNANLTI